LPFFFQTAAVLVGAFYLEMFWGFVVVFLIVLFYWSMTSEFLKVVAPVCCSDSQCVATPRTQLTIDKQKPKNGFVFLKYDEFIFEFGAPFR
jgi:hypothetical protein